MSKRDTHIYKNVNILHIFNYFLLLKTLYLKFRDIAQKLMTEGGKIEINRIILKDRWHVQEINH